MTTRSGTTEPISSSARAVDPAAWRYRTFNDWHLPGKAQDAAAGAFMRHSAKEWLKAAKKALSRADGIEQAQLYIVTARYCLAPGASPIVPLPNISDVLKSTQSPPPPLTVVHKGWWTNRTLTKREAAVSSLHDAMRALRKKDDVTVVSSLEEAQRNLVWATKSNSSAAKL